MGRAVQALIAVSLTAALPSMGAPLKAAGGTWPGTWPPVTSIKCPRDNQVPFAWMNNSIGKELTQLHANRYCVPQPVCRSWVQKEDHMLPGPVSGNFWQGQTSYSFTTGDQNSIVATARTIAIAQTPAGKQFYRLTFDQAVLTGKSTGKPMSTGIVTARTYYGKCITDVSTKTGPGKQQ